MIDQGATPAKWNRYERRQRDTEARWTKKHGRSFFGYKLSINADNRYRYKLIRRIVISDAAEHDSRHFNRLLERGNTGRAIYADRGYASARRERALAEADYSPESSARRSPASRWACASAGAIDASHVPAPGSNTSLRPFRTPPARESAASDVRGPSSSSPWQRRHTICAAWPICARPG